MEKIVNIFDFDFTLTPMHTFKHYSREHFPNPFQDIISIGQTTAKKGLKANVREFLKHDLEHFSAIASYHNNPLFIAGFVSELLNKKFVYIKTHKSGVPGTAIDQYAITGVDSPFFISYITALGPLYTAIRKQLEKQGKNEQINSLRRLFVEEGFIDTDTMINYYDDTEDNYTSAKVLEGVNRYLIDGDNPIFTIKKFVLYSRQRLYIAPQSVEKPFQVSEPVVNHATLKASIDKLNKLEFKKETKSIQPLLRSFIKQLETLMEEMPIPLLQKAVDKTYELLLDPHASLRDYRVMANSMKGKSNQTLHVLGALMLAIAAAIALILVAAIVTGCSAVVLAPTAICSAGAFAVGGYSLFAGRSKDPCLKMNKIADNEACRRA